MDSKNRVCDEQEALFIFSSEAEERENLGKESNILK